MVRDSVFGQEEGDVMVHHGGALASLKKRNKSPAR